MQVYENQVTFFRYYRPTDSKTGYAASDKGTCFCIVIDYDIRELYVSASVCNGDNFSKREAKILATSRMRNGYYYTFALDDFISISQPATLIQFLREQFDAIHAEMRNVSIIKLPRDNLVASIVRQLHED
jgi:hypothetical protein